ncbi:MAG: diacylglycerol kinase family protein [Patescibacteria group bacterium]
MHVYIYDDFLDKGKYNKIINRIEIRLTDLGLNGKIIRLSGIKNIKGAVQNEVKLGAKTIIAVGDNQTINKIIGAIIDTDIYGDFQKKTLLGIIPVGDDNSIAASFGVKNEMDACNILLARRIEQIDLGLAGKYYFLNQASIQSLNTVLKIKDYSLEVQEKGEIKIINLLSGPALNLLKSNPHDGLLDIYIKTRKRDESVLKIDKIKISNPENKLLIDGVMEIDTPVELSVLKNQVNVIVGRDRAFE